MFRLTYVDNALTESQSRIPTAFIDRKDTAPLPNTRIWRQQHAEQTTYGRCSTVHGMSASLRAAS